MSQDILTIMLVSSKQSVGVIMNTSYQERQHQLSSLIAIDAEVDRTEKDDHMQ